jgi:hypothetical protein
MKPPPKEWFESKPPETKQPEKVSENSNPEMRSTLDWFRLLEVYSFLFEAREKK